MPELPAATLTLTDDGPGGTQIDLHDLHETDWAALSHAHGSAEDIPVLIEAMAHGYGPWNELNSELIGDDVLHQGTSYSATSHVMPFLARMVTSDILPADQRADVYRDLLYAAARGCQPSPAPWAQEVHDTVAALTPGLLERWPVEPPRTRLMLAVLAALVSHRTAANTARIAEMGRQYAGTDVAALLELAAALIAREDQRAHPRWARPRRPGAADLDARRRVRRPRGSCLRRTR